VVKGKPALIANEVIPGVFSEPKSPMNVIDALQKFYDAILGKSPFKLRDLYSQLCDFSHPGILGVRGFVSANGQHSDGRRLQYHRRETLVSSDAENLLVALMLSMRGGHACAALMHCGEIIVEKMVSNSLNPTGPLALTSGKKFSSTHNHLSEINHELKYN
jgi:hypothetical protein